MIERYGNPWIGGGQDQPHFLLEMVNVCHNVKIEVEKIAEINRRIKENAKSNPKSLFGGA